MKSYVKDFRNGLEVVSFKDKPIKPIRGLITVELFDAATKKKVLEAKTENLITSTVRDHMLWDMKEDFFRGCPGTLPAEPAYPLSHIALYSSSDPEADEPLPDLGSLIGWCNKTAYSGSNKKRGTINTAESYATNELVHWVFDWPTHAGNGTFQTIVWCSFNESLLSYTLTSDLSLDIYPLSPRGLAWDGTNLWLAGDYDNKIYKLNPSTGAVISSFASPDSTPYGLAWDGTNLWLAGEYARKIYKLNPTNGSIISSFASPDQYPRGLAWDGTNLWLAGDYDNKIYKLNPSTGAVISSFASPDSTPYGLAWDGTNLWLAGDYDNKIYKLNPTNGSIISSFVSPDQYPYGLAWDGTNLWLAGDSARKIYKLRSVIGTRTLLASSVTKTSTNTMKIQYDFVFQE